MADAITPSVKTRQAVAHGLARLFLRHLEVEIQKPEEILQEDYPALPVRDMIRAQIGQVRREFGIAEDAMLPARNLFQQWCELNGKFRYEDSAIIGYNRMFLPRLLDLREGTPESWQGLTDAMKITFDNFDHEKQGFTVAFFLDSENTMRELLREAVREHLPGQAAEADQLVLTQSRFFQTAMYQYFENILKATLAENVRLLHGILPQPVASELKRNGFVQPVHFKEAAVIFTDFEGFSRRTEHLAPAEVIRRLDAYFTEFDRISAAFGLEKIKTIGDSYMAVAGVPEAHHEPIRAACDAALAMLETCRKMADADPEAWNIRIGIHVGPLVAGVIGRQKFSYDVWGATVNFASRMESSGAPGRINVSAEVHKRVGPSYLWEARGAQPIKLLGTAEMFFLLGRKS